MSFDWLKAVFLYNCMENMETFTSLYAIAYAIMNSMENLRFGKEGYFHVLVFYTGYFIKEIENPCSHTLQKHSRKFGRTRRKNIRGSLGELDVKTLALRVRVPTSISRSPKTSIRVFTTAWKYGKCFVFLNYYNFVPRLFS